MKKLYLLGIAASLLLATTATAQEKETKAADPEYKGWWIGGQIGYWNNDGENTYVITPEFGYDFNQNWAMGISVGLVGSDDAAAFEFAPYARWKFYRTGRLSLFLDGGFGAVFGDLSGFKIGFQPGLSVKINKHFSFLTHIGFLGYCNEFYNGGEGDGFGFRCSSSDLKLGFYYTF